MSERYYISLGAGHHQKPLIQAAKQLGLKVIGIDMNLDASGMQICDLIIQESILNYRKIMFKIQTAFYEGEIAGGFCASYGPALASWAYLVERLNLTGLSRTMTEILLDKITVRRKCSGINDPPSSFAQPGFLFIEGKLRKSEIEALGYPLIVKTSNGSSKRNIFEITHYQQIQYLLSPRKLKELGIKPEEVLIEQKIDGPEITVVGLVENFKYHLISITDKVTTTKPPFIELEHIYPSQYQSHEEELHEIHQRITDHLQIPCGPLVSEFKFSGGKWFLIEISPQIPGGYIGSFIIPNALKYDFFANIVRLSIGAEIETPVVLKKIRKARIEYIDNRLPNEMWESKRKKAQFARILNENPAVPPTGNHDRYAVLGYSD